MLESYEKGIELSNTTSNVIEQYASKMPITSLYKDRYLIGTNILGFALKFVLGKYVPNTITNATATITLFSLFAYTTERALQNFFFSWGLNKDNDKWETKICPSMRMIILDTLYPMMIIGLLNKSGHTKDEVPIEMALLTPFAITAGQAMGVVIGRMLRELGCNRE